MWLIVPEFFEIGPDTLDGSAIFRWPVPIGT